MAAGRNSGGFRGTAEWHDAASWRSVFAVSLFLSAVAVAGSFLGLAALSSIAVVGATVTSFTAGYSFRQRVLDRGQLPWFRWLWLRGDPLLGENDRPVPPPASPPTT